MAFGIPGSEDAGPSGQFLGRLQYDARVGFWKIVKRVQQSDGGWEDDASEPFKNPSFLLDVHSLEVGYIRFASPPVFMVVPYGTAIPPRPTEKMTNQEGQERNAYLPGFRCKVYNPKLFNDDDPYYFANNSKTVMNPMDALYNACLAAPEAKAGKVPLVEVTGTTAVKVEGPKGTNTYYAPVFKIRSWHDRPDLFGPRTVAIIGKAVPAKPAGQAAAEDAAWSAHNKANAPRATTPSRHVGPPAGHPAAFDDGATAADDLNEVVPF